VAKRNYSNWLSGYAEYTKHSESPDLFHFWTGVFTIAGALRRQVWIDQRYFQWTPNFYIILVGPAGIAAKSTSLRLGTALLRKVDGIKFGPKSMTWQALTHSLEDALALVPMSGSGLDADFIPMSCITCSVTELGTFLRPEDKVMMDVLVDLWDGQQETWERRTVYKEGQVSIENPWINIMGCTTPTWLRDNMPEAMIGGGLIRRIVFVYGDEKRQLIAYPADLQDAAEFHIIAEKLIEDLVIISELKGEYSLTPTAKKWGIKWYDNHWKKKPEHMVSERFSGYIATKQSHIHKLAMVLAAAQRNELTITKEDLFIADKMMTGLEPSMQAVFQSIGAGDMSRMVMEILAYVRAYKVIPEKTLWRAMMHIMGPKEFSDASNAAAKAGYLVIRGTGQGIMYCALDRDEK